MAEAADQSAEAAGSTPAPGSESASEKPVAKPIPNRVSLPGVHEDVGEEDRESRSRDRLVEPRYLKEKREAPESATPDPDKIDREEKARAESKKAKAGKAEEPEDEDLESLPAEKLIARLKTLQGMHKSLQREAEGGSKRVRAENTQLRGTALAWKERAELLEAENAKLRGASTSFEAQSLGGEKPSPKKGASPSVAEEILGELDWDTFEQLAKDQGLEVALLWKDKAVIDAMEQRRVSELDRLRQEFDERLSPREIQDEHAAAREAVKQLFHEVSLHRNRDESWTYPELRSEDSAKEVGRIWIKAAREGWYTPDFLANPMSVHHAVSLYRDVVAYRARQGGNGRPAPTLEEKPATDAEISKAAGVATVGDLGGTASPARTGRALTRGEMILRSFREGSAEADKQRKELGFAP